MKRKPVTRPSEEESIEATAAAWLAQRDDAFTKEDEATFAQWRSADARHEAAVARLEATWARLQPLREFRPSALRHPDRDLLVSRVPRRAVAFPARWAAWAAAVVVVACAGWWGMSEMGTERDRYTTTNGGYGRVLLADQSIMELNGDTVASVRFDRSGRRVRLERGEAHFTVVKDATRPFWVEAGGVSVRAVGTAFNVRLGSDAVEVLVTEGRVEVGLPEQAMPRGSETAVSADPAANPSTAGAGLGVNERLWLPTGRATAPAVVERLSPEVIRETLAWQGTRVVFSDTPLVEVAGLFNRRNQVQILLGDPELATLPVGGSFRVDNVEAFVRLLESGGDVLVDRSDPSKRILRRAK
jgi:transmembrane sensor